MDRDRYLAEVIGEWEYELSDCKHFQVGPENWPSRICATCGLRNNTIPLPDFSTWQGFGVLWDWAKEQEWWADFMSRDVDTVDFYENLIDPDNFADAIYELLTESV